MTASTFALFLAAWAVFVLLPCYLAGSTWIARANQQIGEPEER